MVGEIISKKIKILLILMIVIAFFYLPQIYMKIKSSYLYNKYDLKDKPSEYFDTEEKRAAWWYSQDIEWKEVFKTVHFADYLYSDSWPLSEIKYILGMPFFPDDEYISHFFAMKSINCERTYPYGAYTPPKQMEEYLTNLSGISSLTNLEYLYLSNSRIDNFQNILRLKKLKVLWLENANLKNLDILNYVHNGLIELCLDYNFLRSFSGIGKLKNLKKLNCSNNSIESLKDLTELKELEFIDCNNNKIKSIKGIENLERLKTLIIYDNPVTDSLALQELEIKNLITTQKDFFEWQSDGHVLCEHLFDMQTGFYKKFGYLTYNIDSLQLILPLGGANRKAILNFNDSTIVVKREKGFNKFSYKTTIVNDSVIFDYNLIEKVRNESAP